MRNKTSAVTPSAFAGMNRSSNPSKIRSRVSFVPTA
jgi:hypothetical protein